MGGFIVVVLTVINQVWSGSHPKFCKENTTDSQFSGGVMPQLMAVTQGRLVRTRVLVVTKCDDTS